MTINTTRVLSFIIMGFLAAASIVGKANPPPQPAVDYLSITEIDYLKPYGAQLGIKVSDLNNRLPSVAQRRGFCEWNSHGNNKVGWRINVYPKTGSCGNDSFINNLRFEQHERRKEVFGTLPSPEAMAALWREKFGEPIKDRRCDTPMNRGMSGREVFCRFSNVSDDVGELKLQYGHDPREQWAYLRIFHVSQSDVVADSSRSE